LFIKCSCWVSSIFYKITPELWKWWPFQSKIRKINFLFLSLIQKPMKIIADRNVEFVYHEFIFNLKTSWKMKCSFSTYFYFYFILSYLNYKSSQFLLLYLFFLDVHSRFSSRCELTNICSSKNIKWSYLLYNLINLKDLIFEFSALHGNLNFLCKIQQTQFIIFKPN